MNKEQGFLQTMYGDPIFFQLQKDIGNLYVPQTTYDRDARLVTSPHYRHDSEAFRTQSGGVSIFGQEQVGLSYDYGDRLHQWDGEKADQAWKRAEASGLNKSTQRFREIYLSEYHRKQVSLLHIISGVQPYNGYPWICYGYKVYGEEDTIKAIKAAEELGVNIEGMDYTDMQIAIRKANLRKECDSLGIRPSDDIVRMQEEIKTTRIIETAKKEFGLEVPDDKFLFHRQDQVVIEYLRYKMGALVEARKLVNTGVVSPEDPYYINLRFKTIKEIYDWVDSQK